MFRSWMKMGLLGVACFGGACAPESTEAPGELAASAKQRITAAAPSGDLEMAVTGQNGLAISLLKELPKDARGNLFLSPSSISTALSMTYSGAVGDTAKAFENVLGSGLSAAAHHRAMNDLDAQLTSRGTHAQGADGQPFRLTTANQIFAQKGFAIEVPFLDTLGTEYGANVRLLDFETSAEPSRVAINDWVAEKTEDKIKDLLASGTIQSSTRLVLVNAIYFNAAWAKPFEESKTSNKDFYRLDGTTVSVPTMRGDIGVKAATVDGVEVIELPYDGKELSMWVMMPLNGDLPAFEAGLTDAKLKQYANELASETLDLSFPRFETQVKSGLKAPLTALGLGIAFDGNQADFTAITSKTRLVLTDIVHQAFVKVNEKGTEAAAATGVIVGATSVPQMRTVEVNRPFIFAVRDNATHALVFLGRMADPS